MARSRSPQRLKGLSITRRPGEAVMIGAARLAVHDAHPGGVTLRLTADGGHDHTFHRAAGEGVRLSPSVSVYVASARPGQVRLAVDAPREMSITRAERA